GEQAPLPVVGEAIGHVRGPSKGGDAVRSRPAAQVVARHVAEQEEPARGVPDWPLGEAEAGTEDVEGSAHLLTGCPGVPAAYQSAGGTSSKTTHTASRGTLQTSWTASVTRLASSSFRSLP